MKFYYTAVSKPNVPQSDPALSLGGFKSSSAVPNADFGNLFSDISSFTIQSGRNEYIGLILENVLDKTISNLKLWIETPKDSVCSYRLAIVELSDEGELERVSTINSKPFVADFQETSKENPIEIVGDFTPQSQVGVWIERIVKSMDTLLDTTLSTVEECNLKLEY